MTDRQTPGSADFPGKIKADKLIVGGGPKKVLYTLRTVKRIGLRQSSKALKSHNACKACGLGMGGQRGGMVNELDEFPSVCNKSIQAQLHILAIMNTDSGDREHLSRPRIGLRAFLPQVFTISQFRQVFS